MLTKQVTIALCTFAAYQTSDNVRFKILENLDLLIFVTNVLDHIHNEWDHCSAVCSKYKEVNTINTGLVGKAIIYYIRRESLLTYFSISYSLLNKVKFVSAVVGLDKVFVAIK